VGLLPGRLFEALVNKHSSDKLTAGLNHLFTAMQGGGLYGNDDIPWFNGGLFKKVFIPVLTIMEMTELRNAAALNWSAIDVSIFGTLFERGLDPSKRSQLGAHYTDPATIDRIIDPVLRRPLLQKWETVARTLRALLEKSTKKGDKNYIAAKTCFHQWLDELKHYRMLDPACGSGNFLFLGLKALKDIEFTSHTDAAKLGLDQEIDLVTGPHNVLGIELNEYAAELARLTVWIGELQWRKSHGYEFKTNPVLDPLDHIECRDALLAFPAAAVAVAVAVAGIAGANPNSEYIATVGETGARVGQMPGAHTLRCSTPPPTSAPPTPLSGLNEPVALSTAASEDDAAGTAAEQDRGSDPNSAHDAQPGGSGIPELGSDPIYCGVTEATWPQANIVIGNPPFLGGSKKRRELGDAYFAALDSVFSGRVPGGADLVCYWFDKARQQIQSGLLQSAGLVATQAIRAGANRRVLERLLQTNISDHNSDHEHHHLRHPATCGTTAHGGHTAGAGRSRGESDRQEPGQSGNTDGSGGSPGAAAHRSSRAEMDDGPDDRRRDVAGAQDFLLNASPISIFNAWADEP